MPRITGKLGRISLNAGGAFVADLFNWTAEWELELEPCGIKGEIAEKYSVGAFTGRITAERFSTTTDNDSVFADGARDTANTANTIGSAGGGEQISYVLQQVSGGLQGTSIAGIGIISRGSLTSPRAMALDTLEIQMTSIPTLS